ncbi:tetratricopeptide repeat protein [Enterovirga sp.]|uniref:tetratricopeptide repeat protein n=1 Tax=Enterovirga sp. TaxID=2026350 RepID=UPI003FA57BEA
MRISDGIGLAASLLFAFCAASSAQAADIAARATPLGGSMLPQQLVQPPQTTYASVKEALRAGMRDYNSGDKVSAVRAFDYAAGQGAPLALWKAARMYADGDGVGRNEVKAFQYFSRLADDCADESPDSPRAGLVANAFTSLGIYYLDGIKGTSIKPNPPRAVEMFSYAASYFGDPSAQFNLARLYLDGHGLARDPRQAARWLNLAAEKGHSRAQALLGQLLVNGEGVPMQRARGLMWLDLALQSADARSQAWVKSLHEEAFGGASETDRRTASALSEQYQARRR